MPTSSWNLVLLTFSPPYISSLAELCLLIPVSDEEGRVAVGGGGGGPEAAAAAD